MSIDAPNLFTKLLALSLFASGTAFAAPAYDTAVGGADLSAGRSTAPGGGLAFQAFSGTNFSATLTWAITPNATGFTYRYDFDTPTGTGNNWNALSHLILDLSDDCNKLGSGASSVYSSCFTNLRIGYSPNQASPAAVPASAVEFGSFSGGPGNPGMPATIVGAKFGNGNLPVTVIFDSDRVPVWGDFYVKQGNPDAGANNPNGFALWNLGLANHASDNKLMFVARPDTVLAACTNGQCANVPAPGTVALLGLGFAALGVSRRRIRTLSA